jgi:hypothetical protein
MGVEARITSISCASGAAIVKLAEAHTGMLTDISSWNSRLYIACVSLFLQGVFIKVFCTKDEDSWLLSRDAQ